MVLTPQATSRKAQYSTGKVREMLQWLQLLQILLVPIAAILWTINTRLVTVETLQRESTSANHQMHQLLREEMRSNRDTLSRHLEDVQGHRLVGENAVDLRALKARIEQLERR